MKVFTQDPEVIRIGADYLLIISGFYMVFSAMFAINGALRGAGDTLIPMFITLLSLWFVRIPVSWVLAHSMGINGIWWGAPIAWFLGMSLSYLYYMTGRWRTKTVIRHPEPAGEIAIPAEDPNGLSRKEN